MGKRTKIVEVVPYNPEWKREFDRIKEMLEGQIGDLILGIEHVGSTSVEGLSAKPVIDIDVVMESYEVFPDIVSRLNDIGYDHEGDLGVKGREAFKRRVSDDFMKYHLYVCPKNGQGYLEHRAFRDELRRNEAAMREYESLKLRLAEEYRTDIDTYCEKKTDFVRSILARTLYSDRGGMGTGSE